MYAVKIHPHLATRPDELVMTYMSNAFNMSILFANATETKVYTPQILRTRLGVP